MKESFYRDLQERIKPNFIAGGSHAFDHTQRVYDMALRLARNKEVDRDVIKAAALLHDIGRLKEDKKEIECHAQYGSKEAPKILSGMGFPEDKIKKVAYAIRVHRHSNGIKAETLEAAILQDADRLDALGAITIARMFSTGGELHLPIYLPEIPFNAKTHNFYTSTLHGFYHKIFKITPDSFNTPEARKIARGRYKFVKSFVKRLLEEWDGRS